MLDLITELLGTDAETILDELYVPVLAAVAASWAILGFSSVCTAFSHVFLAIFNLKRK